jgi:hypothetical protein
MAPKAYDEETHRELRTRDPDEVLIPDEHSYRAVFAPLRNISLGEALTVLTLLYVCTIAAFNAAYFSSVPGNFVEFFSLTDLIQTNIPIIQYFLGLAFIYLMISLAISFFAGISGFDLRDAIRDVTEPLVIKYHLDSRGFWIVYGIFLLAFSLVDGMLRGFGVTTFSVVMLPTIIFQGVLLYFFLDRLQIPNDTSQNACYGITNLALYIVLWRRTCMDQKSDCNTRRGADDPR